MYPLCGQFSMPVVTASVDHVGSRGHASNEHIRIADFVAGAQYIVTLLEELAARDSRDNNAGAHPQHERLLSG